MKEGWIKIYSNPELYQVKIAEDILKQNGIESHIIGHQDSAIPAIGEARLYTISEKAEAAVQVLRQNNIINSEEEE